MYLSASADHNGSMQVIGEDPLGLEDIAQQVVGRYVKTHPDAHRYREMILSAARLGAAEAARTYRAGAGASLRSWVWARAYGQIIDDVRREAPLTRGDHQRGRTPADFPAAAPASLERLDDNGDWRNYIGSGLDSGYAAVEARCELRRLAQSLTVGQLEVIVEYDLRDRRMIDVANDLGINESGVSHRRRAAFRAMREAALENRCLHDPERVVP